ncbi:unnamed protein product [Thlaspi arvense]|uniref:Uncharacterized protein n=1 Tax=Thlaspi arvense TaxID=13288 RepID=A0AAU9T8C9_THLAR|nr:unnamed protein product [Thlaspi arvense]
MVARKFLVRHDDSDFAVDYDTDDGLEVFKFQLFSLTSIPPDEQKILGSDDDRAVLDDSDLVSISERLRLVSVNGQVKKEQDLGGHGAEMEKFDEELARMLQEEEDALMFQQFDREEEIERRIRPYISQVLMVIEIRIFLILLVPLVISPTLPFFLRIAECKKKSKAFACTIQPT